MTVFPISLRFDSAERAVAAHAVARSALDLRPEHLCDLLVDLRFFCDDKLWDFDEIERIAFNDFVDQSKAFD